MSGKNVKWNLHHCVLLHTKIQCCLKSLNPCLFFLIISVRYSKKKTKTKTTETLSKNKSLKAVRTFLEGFINIRATDGKWLRLLLVLRDRGKVAVGEGNSRSKSIQRPSCHGSQQGTACTRTIKGSLEYMAKAFKMTCLSAWMPKQCFRNTGLLGGESLCLYRRAAVNLKALQLFLMYLCLLKKKNKKQQDAICLSVFLTLAVWMLCLNRLPTGTENSLPRFHALFQLKHFAHDTAEGEQGAAEGGRPAPAINCDGRTRTMGLRWWGQPLYLLSY